MAVTLRQLQRWLHASQERPRDFFVPSAADDIGQFAGWLRGDSTSAAFVRNGQIVSTCGCDECSRVPLVDSRVTSLVDSLAKKHGASTTLESLMRQDAPEGFKNPDGGEEDEDGEDGDGDGDNEGSGSDGDGEDSDNESDGEGQSGSGSESDSQSQSQPKQGQSQGRESPAQAQKREQKENLQDTKQKLRDLQEKLKERPHSSVVREQIKRLKRALKDARRAVSSGPNAGPSLEARKQIAGAHGRLRNVSPALRAEMAALINLLVGQGKAAGGQMGPIPVLSPRKLVARMLSQRPLANALKEDVVTGRPVTLFLPDVSPSCERQAQAACDVANAAGYSGISGSDVLVFPHSNGCVDEYSEEYVPWFNGKPYTTDRAEIARLFNEVTSGKGKWRVRAVVIIGDHDGAGLYQQIAALQRIVRMVWLHNEQADYSKRTLDIAEGDDRRLYGWPPESLQKVSMVYGCITQPHMVKGLRMALQDQ
jgi:hypothetical protein